MRIRTSTSASAMPPLTGIGQNGFAVDDDILVGNYVRIVRIDEGWFAGS